VADRASAVVVPRPSSQLIRRKVEGAAGHRSWSRVGRTAPGRSNACDCVVMLRAVFGARVLLAMLVSAGRTCGLRVYPV
jgi:hypothetical protein